jgi:hypothetical protein
VIKAFQAAGASDPETPRVLGNLADDATLAARAAARQTRVDERVIDLDSAVVILPSRMFRAHRSRFQTIEEYARRFGRTQLLQSLLQAP